jgi:hypothetical protein
VSIIPVQCLAKLPSARIRGFSWSFLLQGSEGLGGDLLPRMFATGQKASETACDYAVVQSHCCPSIVGESCWWRKRGNDDGQVHPARKSRNRLPVALLAGLATPDIT